MRWNKWRRPLTVRFRGEDGTSEEWENAHLKQSRKYDDQFLTYSWKQTCVYLVWLRSGKGRNLWGGGSIQTTQPHQQLSPGRSIYSLSTLLSCPSPLVCLQTAGQTQKSKAPVHACFSPGPGLKIPALGLPSNGPPLGSLPLENKTF